MQSASNTVFVNYQGGNENGLAVLLSVLGLTAFFPVFMIVGFLISLGAIVIGGTMIFVWNGITYHFPMDDVVSSVY